MNALFYISAIVAVISTLFVITRANAVHALLYLIVSLLSIALVFYLFGAPFAAALEVIIYAGAIMVLFVFVVMMLNLGPQALAQEQQWLRLRAWRGPSLLAAILLAELIYMATSGGGRMLTDHIIGPKDVGIALFGPYLMGVELASFLLLSGLVGAYHLGRRSVHPPRSQEES